MSFKSASYEFHGPFSAGEIADHLEVKIAEDQRDKKIEDIAPLDSAGQENFSFLDNPKYLAQFKSSKAGACVVKEKYLEHAPDSMVVLVSDDPHRSYALAVNMFYKTKKPKENIHPSAIIEDGAELAEGVLVGANSVIKNGVKIGANTRIENNVTIEAAEIGENCIIYTGARIGQDGFGFSMSEKGYLKIPQLGGVVIGDYVEIGANTTIDRGAGPNTTIGDHTKIDNLVQIGHNCQIGNFCVIVSQVGIAGSTKVGDYTVLGGQVGVSGHITIGKNVYVAAGSGIPKDVPDGEKIGGYPAMNIRDWHKSTIAIKKLIK